MALKISCACSAKYHMSSSVALCFAFQVCQEMKMQPRCRRRCLFCAFTCCRVKSKDKSLGVWNFLLRCRKWGSLWRIQRKQEMKYNASPKLNLRILSTNELTISLKTLFHAFTNRFSEDRQVASRGLLRWRMRLRQQGPACRPERQRVEMKANAESGEESECKLNQFCVPILVRP